MKSIASCRFLVKIKISLEIPEVKVEEFCDSCVPFRLRRMTWTLNVEDYWLKLYFSGRISDSREMVLRCVASWRYALHNRTLSIVVLFAA